MAKVIGSTFLVAGTALGAGMLALPLVAAKAGFLLSALLLIGVWAVMTTTALFVLEVNLAFDAHRNNFDSMAHKTLGVAGKIIAWICCLALLYSLCAAYIAGDASLLVVAARMIHINIPNWGGALIFTLVLGGAIFWKTKAVDHINRGLFSLKIILLIVTLVLLMPHVNFVKLIRHHNTSKYLLACVPIFLCSFGFHTVIPSLTNYIGKKPKILVKVIVLGSTIPLIIYLFWLFIVLAILPLHGNISFISIFAHHSSVGGLIDGIDKISNDDWVSLGINCFSNIAMTTSFLGVGIGLFDFLADGFKRSNSIKGRAQSALLAFVLPFCFAIFYPNGFVKALGYAAIFVAILEIVLPVFMVYKLRKSEILTSPYKTFVNNFGLLVILLIGLAIIVVSI